MNVDEIRETFIRFYTERGHLRIPSASLVPHGDPTLLFTGAGMVPFKPYFMGLAEPPSLRMCTVQKCFRTTDIDAVGDYSHLTLFEMLGNFSVGDYFKKEAIAWAWELLTEHFKLPKEKLWVSIFLTDDEAHDLWRGIGVPEERIHRYDDTMNYWPPKGSDAVGPTGPNSEIFVDRGLRPETCEYCRAGTCKPNLEPDCGRFLEVWNLVFMSEYRHEDGTRTELPKKNIDTGSGLERMACILQGKDSVYETDVFSGIIERIEGLTGKSYGETAALDTAIRIVAEHTRASVFLITDGVLPSNEGRGYVLRRILRRAVYHLTQLSGATDGTLLEKVAEAVIARMEGAYPDVRDRASFTTRLLAAEESKFRETLERGRVHLDAILARDAYDKVITGLEAFKLYDTFGYPLELTIEIAGKHGFTVDLPQFDAAMKKQRDRARGSAKFSAIAKREFAYGHFVERTQFVGYDSLEERSRLIGIIDDEGKRDVATTGDEIDLIVETSPMYPEGGGQVGDSGTIEGPNGRADVQQTRYEAGAVVVHVARVSEGWFAVNDAVTARVDVAKRRASQRNHTATHLLHAALRQVLGDHVRQAGSLVAPDRLRFDFTHIEATKPEEIAAAQRLVNEKIREDIEVHWEQMPYDEAVAGGAMALFGEKYTANVRVVGICSPGGTGTTKDTKEHEGEQGAEGRARCFSKELCGGTHCGRTGEIGTFVIASESSVGSGLRRIEALTGPLADAFVLEQQATLARLGRKLNVTAGEIEARVDALQAELEAERRRLQQLERQAGRSEADALLAGAEKIGDASLVVARVTAANVEALREMGDVLREKLGSAVIVLGAVIGERPNFLVVSTKGLNARVHAGNLVKEIAAIAGGGGGGRPDMALAGGKDASKLDEALEVARTTARAALAAGS